MPALFEMLAQHDRGDGVLYEHRMIERDEKEVEKGNVGSSTLPLAFIEQLV